MTCLGTCAHRHTDTACASTRRSVSNQPNPFPTHPPTRPNTYPAPQPTGLQWCIINYDFWHGLLKGQLARPGIDLAQLFQGDFGVAAVLISFGGLLGKVSPTQLLWLCMLEIVFYAINEALVSDVSSCVLSITMYDIWPASVRRSTIWWKNMIGA